MYLRVTERRNRDGSTVVYYALAENVWNAQTKRSEAQVIHTFGRADQLDKAALQRLIASIQRVIDADAAGTIVPRDKTSLPDIEIDAVFEPGSSRRCAAMANNAISCGALSSPSAMQPRIAAPMPRSAHRVRAASTMPSSKTASISMSGRLALSCVAMAPAASASMTRWMEAMRRCKAALSS